MRSQLVCELVKAHYESDEAFSQTVKRIVDECKAGNSYNTASQIEWCMKNGIEKMTRPHRLMNLSELTGGKDLIEQRSANVTVDEMILTDNIRFRIRRIVKEYEKRDLLEKNGLSNRRKILLYGPPGTGKTMTAQALAKTLGLPLLIVKMDQVVKSLLGETAKSLSSVFNVIRNQQGVYLFDEFDSIAASRRIGDDVSEMKRVLCSLLKLLEDDNSQSIIIAATNMKNLIDTALFRRFDDVIEYENPKNESALSLIKRILGDLYIEHENIGKVCNGMSYADIAAACCEIRKKVILDDVRPSGRDIAYYLELRKECRL